jgi:hypothetical protein
VSGGRHRAEDAGVEVREESASDLWAFLYSCRVCHKPHIPRALPGARGQGITYLDPLDQHPYSPRIPGSLLDDVMRAWLQRTGVPSQRVPLAKAMRIDLDGDGR